MCSSLWPPVPVGVADGAEDEHVAVDDDDEGDEENKTEEQHGVGPHRGGKGHVVPGARGQEALRNVRTLWVRKHKPDEEKSSGGREKGKEEGSTNSIIITQVCQNLPSLTESRMQWQTININKPY